MCFKHVDCVYDWHHRHQRISRSVSIVPASVRLGTCAFSDTYGAIMRNGIMTVATMVERLRVFMVNRRVSSDEISNPCALGIFPRGFSAREVYITKNKPRLLLAYITGRYAPSFLLRILLSLFFSLFSNAPCNKRKQSPQVCDVTNN